MTLGTNSMAGRLNHMDNLSTILGEEAPTSWLDVGGHRIAYVDEGEGMPLFFLHNGGTSHAIWTPVMKELAPRYRVVAIDLLGYKTSDRPGNGYTMERYVDIVAQVTKKL